MSRFVYPPTRTLDALRRCQTITLFGQPNDIYKVTFWDVHKRPFIIELKSEFLGADDFGNPDPKGFKEMSGWSLLQSVDKATALQKLIACDYRVGSEPNLDTFLFVKYLLRK